VWFSTGAKISIALTWSSLWRKSGRWSESRTSGVMQSDRRIFRWTTTSSTSPFPCGV
jgi:hypothetical protein